MSSSFASSRASSRVSSRPSSGSAGTPAFDPLSDLPWDTVWWADRNVYTTGTTPASDGQTVQNWGDAINDSEILTQATAGNRPNYRASVAALNGKPAIQGNSALATSLSWTRGSTLPQPYTRVVIGVHDTSTSSFRCLSGDNTSVVMSPWLDRPSSGIFYDGAFGNSTYLGRDHNTTGNLWHTTMNGASSKFGRNGTFNIGNLGSSAYAGIKQFQYPTSGSLNGSGHIAWEGVLPNDPSTYGQAWLDFLAWAETYYGIDTTSRTHLICDGDSRTYGVTYMDATNDHAGTWPYLLSQRFTDSVEVANLAVAGRTQANQNSQFAARVGACVDESVGAGYVMFSMGGLNDIATGSTGAAVYDLVCDWVDAVHAKGGLALVGTVAPSSGVAFSGSSNTQREALNTLILANAGSGGGNGIADGVVDIADDADGTASNPFAFSSTTTPHNPGNFHSDAVHWSTAGNVIIANMIETALAVPPFSLT